MPFDITPELKARIDAIAQRSTLTPSEVVTDALENGHSLEWQERFLDKVAAGTAAADSEDFASPGEVERVLMKYRPS
ncbi:transcriptional regulator [Corticibacterium sp. UT-5YL-CI-8]|nr:transcriptional regulator [Tianweitania sp. UT-5YL-CI-8]